MTNAQNTPIVKEPVVELVEEGLRLGSKAGLIVSTLYSTAGLIVMEFLGRGLLSSPPSPDFQFWGNVVLIVISYFMILLYSIAPATLIGAITGMYLGQLTKLLGKRRQMPRHLFLVVCVASCLVAVIVFHVLFRGPIANSLNSTPDLFTIGTYGTYPLIIGIPSVIYVLTGAWVSLKLYAKLGVQRDEQA